MSVEQQNASDNIKLAKNETQENNLSSQSLDLLAESVGKKAVAPRIGVCPECNPPLDLPQDDPPPKPKPTDSTKQNRK